MRSSCDPIYYRFGIDVELYSKGAATTGGAALGVFMQALRLSEATHSFMQAA
jgi:hypothetical protein